MCGCSTHVINRRPPAKEFIERRAREQLGLLL
jgi:hypothetical protein